MDYISGWCKSPRRLSSCTAVVTGSNTGIGKETARDLYIRGARVILACRDTTKAEAAKKEIELETGTETQRGTLIVEKLDLSNLRSVHEFAYRLLAKEPKIHILINNAGVMMCPKGTTEDGFETHIGTNHFGHALLTLLLLPRLKKSAPSRIVCVSSYLHQNYKMNLDNLNFEQTAYDPMSAYCVSKVANVLFAKALAHKLREHNITDVTTYSVHPGVIKTEISRHFSETVWKGATWVFNNILGWFLKTPRCGAQTTIYCAVDEACADESGHYYAECATKLPSKQCQDNAFAAAFWEKTIEMLKLKNYNPFGDIDPVETLFN